MSRAGRIKDHTIRVLYWMLRHAPAWMFKLSVRSLLAVMRGFYWVPGFPMRQVFHDVSLLAHEAGHHHDPRGIYWRLTGEIASAIEGAFLVYREGVEANLDRVAIDPRCLAVMRRALNEHNGLILTVPHLPGGIFCSYRISHEIPTLVLTRLDPVKKHKAAMQRDFFEHMGVEMLMARGSTPRQIFRSCVEGSRQGKVVVFSVDNLYTGRPGAVEGTIFGETVELGSWAVRMARRAEVPILPGYAGFENGKFIVLIGDPLLVRTPEEAIQHYLSFFEKMILADPGGWAYLGDRRWRRVLARAADRLRSRLADAANSSKTIPS